VVPYRITADEEKLICENFFLSNKETIIYYRDIESLSGGIFSGKLKGLMKVNDGKSKICIGFFDKIKNVKELQTIILSRVNSVVYNRVVESVGFKKKEK
jgi:predicted AAA+ superfamily ATPase